MKTWLSLLLFVLAGALFAQQSALAPGSASLKEYSYPADGFAIKFPNPVSPHTDAVHSDFKVWTVHLDQGASVAVRLKVDSQSCDEAFHKLQSMAEAQHVRLRIFSVSGRPVWEEQEHSVGNTTYLERYVCGHGRYYIRTFVWSANQPRPTRGVEIMNSFRLI